MVFKYIVCILHTACSVEMFCVKVLERERIQMQQEQTRLKEQLEEATKELELAKEATDNVSGSLPADLTKAGKVNDIL